MRSDISAARILEATIASILDSGTTVDFDLTFYREIGPLCDAASLHETSPEELLHALSRRRTGDLLDFGCGIAGHRRMIETEFGFTWHGINYAEAMPAGAIAQATDPDIVYYDGRVLPYRDGSFDAVYSFLVFEHIQDIGLTFSEIRRVLRPGGVLIGAVSYLEQIHDASTFNFTPYGFKLACDRAGLEVTRIYPRYDVFTWLLRRLLVTTRGHEANSLTEIHKQDGPITQQLGAFGQRMGLSVRDTNLFLLLFSTQFTFEVQRR